MIGAIIGDTVGSIYEFNNTRTKDFELIKSRSRFTDDTVMTIAVMDWAMHALNLEDHNEAVKYLRKWAQKYEDAGYGGRFSNWIWSIDPRPYNSFGNGSAMRISSIGWLFDDIETVKKVSKTITEITHNHPEGLKGAEATAVLVYLAVKAQVN